MKLKKIAVLALAVACVGVLLVGCGEKASSSSESSSTAQSTASSETSKEPATTSADVGKIYEAINAVNTISNPRELLDMNLELDFALNLDTVANYKGVVSNDGDNAGMTLVIEAVDGEVGNIVTALETYKENTVLFWGNYPEFANAAEMVENSEIATSGNVVVQVFQSVEVEDFAVVETAIEEAVG